MRVIKTKRNHPSFLFILKLEYFSTRILLLLLTSIIPSLKQYTANTQPLFYIVVSLCCSRLLLNFQNKHAVRILQTSLQLTLPQQNASFHAYVLKCTCWVWYHKVSVVTAGDKNQAQQKVCCTHRFLSGGHYMPHRITRGKDQGGQESEDRNEVDSVGHTRFFQVSI